MNWSSDPQLQQMFVDEVAERSARLVEGARALRDGTITPFDAGELLREGHTIKGTGRVMGYDDVGSAGLLLETTWRWLQHGDIAPTPILGRVLEALSVAIPGALDDPEQLNEAMSAVYEFLEGQDLPEALPEIPGLSTTAAPDRDAPVAPTPATPKAEEPPMPVASPSPTPPPPTVAEIATGHSSTDEAPVPSEEESAAAEDAAVPLSAQEAFAVLRREMATGVDGDASSPSNVDDPEAASDEDPSKGEPSAEGGREPEPVVVPPVEEIPPSPPDRSFSAPGGGVGEEGADGGGQAVPLEATEAQPDAQGGESPQSPVAGAETEDGTEPVDPVPGAGYRVPDTSGEAGASVIEFPLNATGDGAVDDQSVGEAEVASANPSEHEASDVVVLPSGGRRESPVAEGPTDLGGLVGAIQNAAAEESITVAAARLYGLVDHIVSLRMNLESMREQLVQLADIASADPFFSERVGGLVDELDPIARASDGIEALALALASVPLSNITGTLPQLCRYLGRKTGKELRIEIIGDDVLVDRQVLDKLGEAIRQLVVNSAVHGIEDVDTRLGADKTGTGTIRIEAEQTDANLRVAVMDDGRGINWAAVRTKGLAAGLLATDSEMSSETLRSLLYQPEFSTLDSADELAGDGDGLATVRGVVESMNGSLALESAPGANTTIMMTVPVHHAMQKALLVVAGGITWGIPEAAVEEILEMSGAAISVSDDTTVLDWSGDAVPFAAFSELMGLSPASVPASIVVAKGAAGRIALGVEQVIGMRRVAAKELGTVLAGADAVTGAALLGGDDVVLLVDTARLVERLSESASESPERFSARVLIVDDSKGVQQVVSSALATSGFLTSVASNVAEALGTLQIQTFDAIVVDFSMPRADGVALAHMVRQRHGNLPIVMLSGVAGEADIERAREAGVDAFFEKGDLREGGLAEALRDLITARRAEEQTA